MSQAISISVIIPTRNRAAFLQATLDSLQLACAGSPIECLVIDNGSTDNTREAVRLFSARADFPVRYQHEPCPGLHVGRNLGAQLAQAETLAYLDDDVIVQTGWAEAIVERMADPAIALLGGPCLPLWETGEPPGWIEQFRRPAGAGWILSELSLIDLGPAGKPCPGWMVFGCNFIIRKSHLIRIGGFHPDGMPDHLLKYRGDGESHVGLSIDADPTKSAFYDPKIMVRHRVPQERISRRHLLYVAKRHGIGEGYSLYRNMPRHTLAEHVKVFVKTAGALAKSTISYLRQYSSAQPVSKIDYDLVFKANILGQLMRIYASHGLKQWVLQREYYISDPCPYWKSTC